MTLKDLNYNFSGSLTMTEFVLLSLVILEDSCMLDTHVGELFKLNCKKNSTRAVDQLLCPHPY